MAARTATYQASARLLYQAGGRLLALQAPGQALGPLADRVATTPPTPRRAAYPGAWPPPAAPAPGFLLDRYVY
jgi:hypothetical protein